jgi:transmembrane sensor
MRKPAQDYSNFSATDFILDENFTNWVKNPTQDDNLFWNTWLLNHPERRHIVLEAKTLIQHIQFQTDYNSRENIDQTWNNLSEKFDSYHQPVFPFSGQFKTILRFAAVFAFIGLAATLAWFQTTGSTVTKTYTTGTGETSTIRLSDSSEVFINANSIVTVAIRSGWKPKREAWVKGEAFFKIKKHTKPLKFIVHTHNVDVQVLGTEFNVKNRHEQSMVMLSSGIIEINNTLGTPQNRVMKPGELATFSDSSRVFHVQYVDPAKHSSWIYKRLIFEHTPMSDVATLLKETYGLSVLIPKSTLARKTFTATLPSDNLPILLKAIEESFNVHIEKLDNQLIITDK